MATTTAPAQSLGWRTPVVIVLCGCLMAILTFGPRSTVGFFLQPMTQELGVGRDVFALAIAIQNLLWGAALPFVGAIADRYGTALPLAVGGIVYAAGLALMAYSTSPAMLYFSTGVLVGFGLAGASFTLVLAAFGKLLPASPVTTLLFAAGMGLMWLSTVPPTSGLVSLMFGTRWLATLYGFAFFSHQVGGFLGAWMGGLLYERTGSYDIVWWLAVAFGILSAVINLPIEEKPVLRAQPAAA